MYVVYLCEHQYVSKGEYHSKGWCLNIKKVDEEILKKEYAPKMDISNLNEKISISNLNDYTKIGILFYLFDHAEFHNEEENRHMWVRNIIELYPEGTTNLIDKVNEIGDKIGFPYLMTH